MGNCFRQLHRGIKMNITDISFPHLNIYLSNVPKNFNVFGFSIALYGMIIAIAMLSGVLAAVTIAKKTDQNPDLYWDFFIYAVIFGVIGARIYYVIFEWDAYKGDILSVFNLRQGGLAIYGGVIAAFITIYVFCKLKKYPATLLMDTGLPGLILGQAIGRWGNFFNREVFGEYTDNILAMRLPIDAVRSRDISSALAEHIEAGTNYIQVHPTFLYESLWNLAVFGLIILFWKKKAFQGEIALWYLFGYGVGRFWIEGIRTDQLMLIGTHIPVSQLLAALMAVGALVADIVIRIKKKKTN